MRLLVILFALLTSSAISLDLPDTDGQTHDPLAVGEKKAVLLVFVSPFCSAATQLVREINEIATEYGDRVAIYLVHSDPRVSLELALRHAQHNKFTVKVLLDKEQRLATQLQARIIPEAVVLAPDGKMLYKGRINDLSPSRSRRWTSTSTRDLRDALDAILARNPVAEPQHEASGCKIPGIKPEIPSPFGLRAIKAIAPVFVIGAFLIPVIYGCLYRKLRTAIWLGWGSFVLAYLFFDLFTYSLVFHFYGADAVADMRYEYLANGVSDTPGTAAAVILGWSGALVFYHVGCMFRLVFELTCGRLLKKTSL
jgi:peroxiredoxin